MIDPARAYPQERCDGCPVDGYTRDMLCPQKKLRYAKFFASLDANSKCIGPDLYCSFALEYEDLRGGLIRVMPGPGGYSVYYKRPEADIWQHVQNARWYADFDDAQRYLNRLAAKNNWWQLET